MAETKEPRDQPKRLMNKTTFKIYMTIYKIRIKVLSLGRH